MKMGRRRTLTELYCSRTKVGFVGVVVVVAWFLILAVDNVAEAHVGLTFPPARKFDLDFLDNIR